MKNAQIHIDKALAGLKDFQLATVEHVMQQFFEANKTKLLVADEVGLGKTIVSRGVVAKMYKRHMQMTKNKPFTVIYICSNQAIASQNIEKLNFIEGAEGIDIVEANRGDDRITSLAYAPKEQKGEFNIRIKAFTPATSFDQNSQAGRGDERVLLYRLLRQIPEFKKHLNSLKWLLKGDGRMADTNWDKAIEDADLFDSGKPQVHWYLGGYRPLRNDLKAKFRKSLNSKLPKARFEALYQRLHLAKETSVFKVLEGLCQEGFRRNNYQKQAAGIRPFLAHLRFLLADCCKAYLIADLFVLDEFQRYSQLLATDKADNPGVELARLVLNAKNARVLLLSATPFKPYTTAFDELHGENHHEEFTKVLRFLLQNEDPSFWDELHTNKQELFTFLRHPERIAENEDKLEQLKNQIEGIYASVIARTERMLVSQQRDAMIKPQVKQMDIKPEDIRDFVAFDQIVERLNDEHKTRLPIPIEYAKSSPFPLSFLAHYQHKKQLEKHYMHDEVLRQLISKSKEAWLDRERIKVYDTLFSKKSKEIPNPKIRLLIDETIGERGAHLLWIPPSVPYFEPDGVYKNATGFSKTLIFSSWKMVPRMIATVVSYEAERTSVGAYLKSQSKKRVSYFNEKRWPAPIINFKAGKENDELLNMNNFMLNYPSLFLSSLYDPESNLFEKRPVKEVKQILFAQIKSRLLELDVFRIGEEQGNSQKWSWYSVLLLDSKHENVQLLQSWLKGANTNDEIPFDSEGQKEKETKDAKRKYLNEVKAILNEGYQPSIKKITSEQLDGVIQYLVDLCLSSPAICALRSLRKLYGELSADQLGYSYKIASGFITLFNKAESISILQLKCDHEDFHRKVLQYGQHGNLQAVLDEYFYLLKDSKSVKSSEALADMVSSILALRPGPMEVTTWQDLGEEKKEKTRLRTHYAIDFGEQKLTSANADRQVNIREAFNSPFRPFVLASTSIGQEGLDFHFYCKKIVHWNLPTNPIDFEQREGRIHRFKGYVIRLNLVSKYLHQLEQTEDSYTLWDRLFELAIAQEKSTPEFKCDLVPCWHMEQDESRQAFGIDRIVPLYPFSRDIEKYYSMLKVLAYYRFTFGQPRQEELIQILEEKYDFAVLNDLMVNLSPIMRNAK